MRQRQGGDAEESAMWKKIEAEYGVAMRGCKAKFPAHWRSISKASSSASRMAGNLTNALISK